MCLCFFCFCGLVAYMFFFFFFQAEDVIRDLTVTGVQTCVLPISERGRDEEPERKGAGGDAAVPAELVQDRREEEREGRARVDADAHRDERGRDEQPAIVEGQAHAWHSTHEWTSASITSRSRCHAWRTQRRSWWASSADRPRSAPTPACTAGQWRFANRARLEVLE